MGDGCWRRVLRSRRHEERRRFFSRPPYVPSCGETRPQTRAGQGRSGQVRSTQVSSDQARPGSGQLRSGQARPGQVRSGQVEVDQG